MTRIRSLAAVTRVGRSVLLALLAVAAMAGRVPDGAAREVTPELIHALALPSVAGVESVSRSGETFRITGVFIAPGVLATAFHAVKDLRAGRVILELRGRTVAMAAVIASDPRHDIALVSVPAARGAPRMPMAAGAAARAGDRIFVLGNPDGLLGVLIEGRVSELRQVEGAPRIELSVPGARINPGSPVIDTAGRMIGMARSEVVGGTRVVFAEPAGHVAALLNDMTVAALPAIAPAAGPVGESRSPAGGMPYWFAAAIVAVVLVVLGWHRWREDRAAASAARRVPYDAVDRVAAMAVHHHVDVNQLVRFGGGTLYDRVLERCQRCAVTGLCVRWLAENADGDFPYCPNHDVWGALPTLFRDVPPRR